jgi:hypothetical protein
MSSKCHTNIYIYIYIYIYKINLDIYWILLLYDQEWNVCLLSCHLLNISLEVLTSATIDIEIKGIKMRKAFLYTKQLHMYIYIFLHLHTFIHTCVSSLCIYPYSKYQIFTRKLKLIMNSVRFQNIRRIFNKAIVLVYNK